MPAGPALSSVWWMVIATLATDAGLLGAIHLVARAGADAPVAEVAAVVPQDATGAGPHFAQPPTAWARCLATKDGQPPSLIAITYLDRGRDDAVTLGEVRGWFGKLAPGSVQIWRLESRDARVGRRIAFEVPASGWPSWLAPAPTLALEARCDALTVALRAHGVGRPRTGDEEVAMDAMTRSRHDLEFLFPRRVDLYTTMIPMGTVADLTEARFADHLRWIDEPAAAP